MAGQIVTISFFRFHGFQQKYWAFSMMQLAHSQIMSEASGLTFYKLLGSGGVDGFSWKPNFGVYGFLGVWEDEKHAHHFFRNSKIFNQYTDRSTEFFTTYLSSIKSHGTWSKVNPFLTDESVQTIGSIAVLTRATIRASKLPEFWFKVAGVSDTLKNYKGRRFSIGIGEWPLIQQATFSIWNSQEEMMDYAYKNPIHRKVIHNTRARGWYSEELFARFSISKLEGTWDGQPAQYMKEIIH